MDAMWNMLKMALWYFSYASHGLSSSLMKYEPLHVKFEGWFEGHVWLQPWSICLEKDAACEHIRFCLASHLGQRQFGWSLLPMEIYKQLEYSMIRARQCQATPGSRFWWPDCRHTCLDQEDAQVSNQMPHRQSTGSSFTRPGSSRISTKQAL